MKAFLRLVRGVCAVGKLSVQAISRTYKIVGTARKGSPTMNDERLVMSALISCARRFLPALSAGRRCGRNDGVRRFLHSALSTSLPSVEMTRGKVGLGSLDRLEVTFGKPAVPHSAKARRALKPYSLHLIPLNYLKPYTIYLTALNVLFCVCLAHARQSSSPEAAYGVALSTDSIKPLQIGDTIPEALWHMPLQMVKAGQGGSTVVTLNDYRGKLIILDFWATWCTACIQNFPKMESLQKDHLGDLNILPITMEDSGKVRSFLSNYRRNMGRDFFLGTILEGEPIKKAFPHSTIPHYVWIDRNGVFMAATAAEGMEENIKRILNEETVALSRKIDRKIDYNRPLFMERDEPIPEVKYRMMITAHLPGMNTIASSIPRAEDNIYSRVFGINCSIEKLLKMAYPEMAKFHRSRVILAVSEPGRIRPENNSVNVNWNEKNTYCYERIMPPVSGRRILELMAVDIENFFDLTCTMEERTLSCWVIERLSSKVKSTGDRQSYNNLYEPTNGGKQMVNQPIKILVAALNHYWDNMVIDETNEGGNLDLKLPDDLRDIEGVQNALRKQGFLLRKDIRKMKVFVIADRDK
ncbi:MAG: TlpA family protein disulfide reductase [Olivibacter sp.]|nr:TlpA family protein disulfide reductase [Olivibacter sp. UJ_SKK_5.1]